MNKENASKLWKIIQEAGDYLVGQLPNHPNHPKGRNPYAHVAICVKSKFDASYKDIPDEKYDKVVEYIDSSGVSVLIELRQKAEEQSKKFTIKSPSEQVSSVLKMAKLYDFFTII